MWKDNKYGMAYIVNKTDGTILTTIVDGTIDNTSSLTLFGKSYSGFGELLNEDLVRLLENSASTASPAAPLRGELWFDTATNQLKVYDGSSFKPASGAKFANTAPTSPTAGDLWVDSDDKQLYFYTGSAWQLAGPVYTDGQQLSGFKIETVGSSGGDKVIASMYSGTVRVAVLSASQFTPSAGSPASTPLASNGFAEIYTGITLNSSISAQFAGTTTTATNLNISGTSNPSGTVIAGGNFMRKDAAQTTQGAITIDDDAGIIVGENQEGVINVSSNNLTIANTSEDKNISFKRNPKFNKAKKEMFELIVLRYETSNWTTAEPEDERDFELLLAKVQTEQIRKMNMVVGFVSLFKMGYLVFKVKVMSKKRDKGARCDQSGKTDAITIINPVLSQYPATQGDEYKLTAENTNTRTQKELCVFQEFLLRTFNRKAVNGRKWFFTPCEALLCDIERLHIEK